MIKDALFKVYIYFFLDWNNFLKASLTMEKWRVHKKIAYWILDQERHLVTVSTCYRRVYLVSETCGGVQTCENCLCLWMKEKTAVF